MAASLFWPLAGQAAEIRLLMLDEAGCFWCARWTEEIGPVYPKTAEGRTAPIIRQDIRAPLPDGVTLDTRARYTPTFVLLVDGAEAGRIEGYPGEDFFWALLGMLFEDAEIVTDPQF
jgi:hypothetical protein